ncbi:MAG: hypothetical protein EA361_01210 [Bacteroidetes bacterium]|nr:MAG: hypothetical protein EA361_01210 [Bacteroidota bacterium]
MGWVGYGVMSYWLLEWDGDPETEMMRDWFNVGPLTSRAPLRTGNCQVRFPGILFVSNKHLYKLNGLQI